jgi:hypothetical protein
LPQIPYTKFLEPLKEIITSSKIKKLSDITNKIFEMAHPFLEKKGETQ